MKRYVAICGYPSSGKSTVQKYLKELAYAVAIDDGQVLRETARLMFGLDEWQVSTQEGKASHTMINGKSRQVREVLGTLGNLLEKEFGEFTIPAATVRNYCRTESQTYSFGSVRKTQPNYYKSLGGIVLCITRPGCGSHFDFDQWDASAVDYVITNDGSQEKLYEAVAAFVRFYGLDFGAAKTLTRAA